MWIEHSGGRRHEELGAALAPVPVGSTELHLGSTEHRRCQSRIGGVGGACFVVTIQPSSAIDLWAEVAALFTSAWCNNGEGIMWAWASLHTDRRGGGDNVFICMYVVPNKQASAISKGWCEAVCKLFCLCDSKVNLLVLLHISGWNSTFGDDNLSNSLYVWNPGYSSLELTRCMY